MGLGWTSTATSLPVVTLATVAGSVDVVAQDGPRVAWLFGDGRGGCDKLAVQNLDTGRRSTVVQSRAGMPDGASCADVTDAGELALAGERALWSARWSGNSEYMTLWEGSVSRAGRAFLYSAYDGIGGGAQYRGIAGSGTTLVYAVTNWTSTDGCPNYESNGGWCPAVRSASPIRRLDERGAAHDVAGSTAGAKLAASGSLVASASGRRISVRRTQTGAIRGFAMASRAPDALAISGATLAVAVGSKIEIYDWRTHKRLLQANVGSRPSSISLSRSRLVWGFNNGDGCREHLNGGGCSLGSARSCAHVCAIWTMNLSDRRHQLVATPKLDPFNVTIVGNRIVWLENNYKRTNDELHPVEGYVRMLRLPR